jgi:holo-[acyl-carrier protein] synthase
VSDPLVGIGTDVVDIDRFREVIGRTPSVVRRVFTEGERSVAEARRDAAPTLAARFAAKEAAMKVLGVGIGEVGWHDVEVVRLPSGRPQLVVTGRAAALAAEQGVGAWHVSLSHSRLVAQAVVAATSTPTTG